MRLGRFAGASAIALTMMSTAAWAQDATDWNGFYAGIYGGYGVDVNGSATSSVGPATLDLGGGNVLSGNLATETGRINGIHGGVVGGYNYQRDRLVLGLEGGFGLGAFGKTNSTVAALSMTDGVNTATIDYTDSTSFNIDWLTTLQGRMGFTQDNWLFYLKGGVVMANASVSSDSRLTIADPGGLIGLPNIDLPSSSTASQLLIGPAFGFGVETMVTEAVSISAEYSFIGLPALEAPAGGLGLGLGGLFGGGGGSHDAAMHQIKAGINYHF